METTTNDPQKPNAMGGAPTTTQDVHGDIAPRPADQIADPAAPPPQPNVVQAAANNQNQVADKNAPTGTQPQPQPAEKPHAMSRIFDGILKTMTGGPVTYIDANGVRREAQQSKGQMGKAIVAAALAGLMTPDRYRQGAFGPVRDFSATAGDAAAAGSKVMEAARAKPQQMSDDEQTRRLMTLTNTTNLAKNMAASALQQHASLQGIVESSQPLLTSIKNYEKSRNADNQPQALIQEGLNHEEALAKLKGHTQEWTAVVSGTQAILNPDTGQVEEHPTYAIVNPHVQVPLSKEATDMYASVNPTYKDAWEKTNGKVTVPLQQAVAAQNLVSEAHILQTFASSAGLKAAFPKIRGDIRPVLSGPDGKRLADALDATRDAISAGAPAYQTLNALQQAPGGQEVLKALNLDPDDVGKYVRDQQNNAIRESTLAKEGGIGDKAPISTEQMNALKKSINGIDDPEERASLMAMVPPDRVLTTGEALKIGNEVRQSISRDRTEKMRTGDPAVLQSEATSMLNGNVSNPKDLAMVRSGGSRMLIDNLLQKGAEARGLNPIEHTFATQEAKAKAFAEYSDPNSKIGAQLSSFDTLMRHTSEAVDANENWVRTNSKWANSKLSDLQETIGNNQDYQRFKDTIIAPMKEYMNFLNQNRAEHDTDIRAMERALGPDATPASALTALTVITQTADARAAGLGQKYLNTVKNNYEGLISPVALQVMQRLGIKSQAGPLSVALPRGWQGNSGSPITPEAQAAFWEASGHNVQYASKLAQENGWIPPKK